MHLDAWYFNLSSKKEKCPLYIYKILFNPVNPELGTIPNWTNKIFKNTIFNLSNPGK